MTNNEILIYLELHLKDLERSIESSNMNHHHLMGRKDEVLFLIGKIRNKEGVESNENNFVKNIKNCC